MLIDEKGKIFGKISIIDILIVLIIIAGVAGVFYKFNKVNLLSPSKSNDIQTTFFVEETPNFVSNSIQKDATVLDSIKASSFGKVTAIEVGNAISYSYDANGQITKSSKPDYTSLKLTVTGKGVYTKSGVSFSGSDYFVGKNYEIRVGNTSIIAKIFDISPVKGK